MTSIDPIKVFLEWLDLAIGFLALLLWCLFLTSCFSVGRLEILLHHISLCLFVFFILSILCLAFEVTRPLSQRGGGDALAFGGGRRGRGGEGEGKSSRRRRGFVG